MNFFNSENLKEHKHHGEGMLPIALYPVYHKFSGNILPHHWHNEFEFIYLVIGQAVFTIDDEVITVKAGEGIFVNSGQIHSGISLTDETSYYSVVFSIDLLTNSFDTCRKYFDGILTNKYKIPAHFKPDIPAHAEVILELTAIIRELTDRNTAYELALKGKLFSLFSIVFREKLNLSDAKQNPLRSKKYTTLKKILEYIFKNYNRKVVLTGISEYVSLSPQYICRFFKEMTGINIIEYINTYRIETAATLLKTGNLSITDIALECGFDNISYFNRVFKKQIGCTPTEFKLNLLG